MWIIVIMIDLFMIWGIIVDIQFMDFVIPAKIGLTFFSMIVFAIYYREEVSKLLKKVCPTCRYF